MNVDLRYQIGRIFLAARPKSFASMFCKLVVVIRVVVSATGSLGQNGVVFYLLGSSNHSSSFRKLTLISIKSNRALRIGFLKAFALRKTITYFGGRSVHTMSLNLFGSGEGHVYHLCN